MSALDDLTNYKNYSRDSYVYMGGDYPFDLVADAATELEQLRAALDEARGIVGNLLSKLPKHPYSGWGWDVLDGLRDVFAPDAAAWLEEFPKEQP